MNHSSAFLRRTCVCLQGALKRPPFETGLRTVDIHLWGSHIQGIYTMIPTCHALVSRALERSLRSAGVAQPADCPGPYYRLRRPKLASNSIPSSSTCPAVQCYLLRHL